MEKRHNWNANCEYQNEKFKMINFVPIEALAKLLNAVENRHSGQAKRDPESRIFKQFWIPALPE
jgi:hypothetical protein